MQQYIKIGEASDFCEKDTARIRDRVNGIKSEARRFIVSSKIALHVSFDAFREAVNSNEKYLRDQKAALEKEHGIKLICTEIISYNRTDITCGIMGNHTEYKAELKEVVE